MSAEVTDHNTDYRVYMAAESCTCVEPDDESSDAYADYDKNHPHGEGVNGWEGRICYLTVLGTYCEECSDDQGDWFDHIPYCDECGYTREEDGTCQCEPEAAS